MLVASRVYDRWCAGLLLSFAASTATFDNSDARTLYALILTVIAILAGVGGLRLALFAGLDCDTAQFNTVYFGFSNTSGTSQYS